MNSRRIIVTGANSGIGKATATALAAAGHHVVLACRSLPKAERAAADMVGHIEIRQLDLADLGSVRAFAEATTAVDVLVNNAGVVGVPLGRTAHGFETHMGTNYLGAFALTCALGDKIADRMVFVGSAGHRLSRLDLDDLNWDTRRYTWLKAYADSKLASMLFVTSLAARGIRAYIAEPGAAGTAVGGEADGWLGWMRAHEPAVLMSALQSDASAARSVVEAVSTDLPSGSMLAPRFLLWGRPVQVSPRAKARDVGAAQRLWDLSAELTGYDWNSLARDCSKPQGGANSQA